MKTIIKGGRVIDPANGIDATADVAVDGNIIEGIGNFDSGNFQIVIDASTYIVTPGLLDHHLHLYPLIENGIPGEAVCFASGVTGAVDAGSTGCLNYEAYRDFLLQSQLTVKAYLNISSYGLASLPEPEDLRPEHIRADCIKQCFKRYENELLGLKIRTSKNIAGTLDAVKRTVELAREISVPVMVHSTDPPESMDSLLSLLSPGDILTHMYHNVGYSLLDENGLIMEAAREARNKGIMFEAADARAHFSFQVSEQAAREGFWPDVISTDLTRFSMYQRPTAFNLAMQMSKYLNLGLNLNEVIRACTESPARLMGLSKKAGCLNVGGVADLAVFKPEKRKNEFGDRPYYETSGQVRSGALLLRPAMTMKRGNIVYRDIAF